MDNKTERFDALLLSLAQHCDGIPEILSTFFSFLRRKTDVMDPPGGWKQLESSFLASLRREYDIAQAAKAKAAAPAESKFKAAGAREVAELPSPSISSASQLTAPEAYMGAGESASVDGILREPTVVAPGVDERPIGNGGKTDKYLWTQTLQDITVIFPLPSGIRAKDMKVDIRPGHIIVQIKGLAPLLDAALHKRIRSGEDESTWTIDDDRTGGKSLTLFLTKENQMEWWAAVAEGEPGIDVTKIDPENSKLGDLDKDTRSVVEKMMFDQRQKMMGLPSSDELKKQEIMANFMKSHPELDFSQAKIT